MSYRKMKLPDSLLSSLSVAFLFVVILTTQGQESDENQMNMKIRNWDTKKRPEVKDDSSHLIIENIKSGSGSGTEKKMLTRSLAYKATPEDSLARRIREEKKRITWQPRWRYVGLGGPWLTGPALSDDQSVLAIVEITGEPDGPNGSRILFLDTYRWQVIRHIPVKERKIAKICFVPDSDLLVCWAEKQISLKQPPQLMVINCRTGRVVAKNDKITEKVSSICPSRNGRTLFVGSEQTDAVRVFSTRELTQVKTLEFTDGATCLVLDPENNTLAVGSKKRVTLFNVSNWKKLQDYPLKGDSPVEGICFIGNRSFVAVNQKGTGVLCRDGSPRSVLENASPLMVLMSDPHNLAVLLRLKSELKMLKLPTLEGAGSAYPRKLKPQTRQDPVFMAYLEHYKCFVFLDGGGDLYFLYKPTKRWRKHLIMSPAK